MLGLRNDELDGAKQLRRNLETSMTHLRQFDQDGYTNKFDGKCVGAAERAYFAIKENSAALKQATLGLKRVNEGLGHIFEPALKRRVQNTVAVFEKVCAPLECEDLLEKYDADMKKYAQSNKVFVCEECDRALVCGFVTLCCGHRFHMRCYINGQRHHDCIACKEEVCDADTLFDHMAVEKERLQRALAN